MVAEEGGIVLRVWLGIGGGEEESEVCGRRAGDEEAGVVLVEEREIALEPGGFGFFF